MTIEPERCIECGFDGEPIPEQRSEGESDGLAQN